MRTSFFLTLHNLQMRHSKLGKAWVVEQQKRIGLFLLFGETRQRNPEQRLGADLKRELGRRISVRAKST
jgi:hypothetical protein